MALSRENGPFARRRAATPRTQHTSTVCNYDGCGGVNAELLYCKNPGCNADNKKIHRPCEEAYAKEYRLGLSSFPRCGLCSKAAAVKSDILITSISTSTCKEYERRTALYSEASLTADCRCPCNV